MLAHDKIRSRFIAALPGFGSVRKSPSKLAYPTLWPAIQVSAETPKSSAQSLSPRQQEKIAPLRNVRASRCYAFARHLRFICLDEPRADASGPSRVRVPITPPALTLQASAFQRGERNISRIRRISNRHILVIKNSHNPSAFTKSKASNRHINASDDSVVLPGAAPGWRRFSALSRDRSCRAPCIVSFKFSPNSFHVRFVTRSAVRNLEL